MGGLLCLAQMRSALTWIIVTEFALSACATALRNMSLRINIDWEVVFLEGGVRGVFLL